MSPGRQIALAALDILPQRLCRHRQDIACGRAHRRSRQAETTRCSPCSHGACRKSGVLAVTSRRIDYTQAHIPSEPVRPYREILVRGSRGLLSILVGYVYSAPGCRLLLVGDEAQLPPVGQTMSTAMSRDRLSSLGLNPVCHTLDVPLRQLAGSGIIHNATLVRQALYSSLPPENLTLHLSGFKDIRSISSSELADTLSDSFAQVGKEETLIITRSNHRANRFSLRTLFHGSRTAPFRRRHSERADNAQKSRMRRTVYTSH